MCDRVQGREIGNVAAVPRPPDVRSRSAASQPGRSQPGRPQPGRPQPGRPQPGSGRVQLQGPGARRATVRDVLDAALRGVALGGRDRRFLSRLVGWDKREAAAVASLLWQARLAGRCEVALSSRHVEIVLAALEDAATYRTSGADAVGCWDCENIPGARCADHARDADRARACTELAAQLASGPAAAGAPPVTGELRLTDISGFRSRASSVAS
jgi:hypothetical protein